jgi:hypothetical protein
MQGLKITSGSFTLSALVAALCFLHSPLAAAHARWDINGIVKPRDTSPQANLKTAPCGTNIGSPIGTNGDTYVRTSTPVTFTPGQTIEVTFEETVEHKSYFRIAFSAADDAGFDANILANDIQDNMATGLFHAFITLPMQACDACTLQLIQVMTDSNTNYYSCSDIKLVSGGGTTPTPTPTPTPTTTPAPTPTPLPALTDPKQIAQTLLEDFAVADTDKNNSIELAEAQALLPGLAQDIFSNMDSNHNGSLSKEELEAAINPPATAQPKAKAASMEWITLLTLLPFALRRLRKNRGLLQTS